MSGVKIVSRHDLYNSESDVESSENESSPILPHLEFDIIENHDQQDEIMQDEEPQEDFEFPLFSMGASTTTINESEINNDEPRGRTEEKQTIMRVTLRSPSPEIINQERPKSYYFTENNELTKKQFEQVALSGDDIIKQSLVPYGPIGKVINLKEFNARIERELQRKKPRPGKKARLAKIKARENKSERSKAQKQIDQKAKAKLMKKIHHKRGGKKHKKSVGQEKQQSTTSAKPKYRTE